MMRIARLLLFTVCLSTLNQLCAQVPQLINFQGRVAVDGVNFNGAAEFKFALVNGDGSASFWSNDGAVTSGKLAVGVVTATSIAPHSIGSAQLATNAAADSLHDSGGLVLSDQSNAANLLNAGYIRIGQVTTDVDYWRQVGVFTPAA